MHDYNRQLLGQAREQKIVAIGACGAGQVVGAAAINETDEEIAEEGADAGNETEEEKTEQLLRTQRMVRQLM